MNLDRTPPNFFSAQIVAKALDIPLRAVYDVEVTRTAQGYTGRSKVKLEGRIFPQHFLLSEKGIYRGGECSCGKMGCHHMARVMLSPALEQLLDPDVAPQQLKTVTFTPAPPAPEGNLPPLSSSLRGWLNGFVERTPLAWRSPPKLSGPVLKYELQPVKTNRKIAPTYAIQIYKAILDPEQRLTTLQPYRIPPNLRWGWGSTHLPKGYEHDRQLLRLLLDVADSGMQAGEEIWRLDEHPELSRLLQGLLATNRLYWQDQRQPLTLGEARPVELGWQMDKGGVQRPSIQLPQGAEVLNLGERWYLDTRQHVLGPMPSLLSPEAEDLFLNIPPVPPAQAHAFRQALQQELPKGELPLPESIPIEREVLPYQPVLTLKEERIPVLTTSGWRKKQRDELLGVAHLSHEYGGLPLLTERQRFENGVLHLTARDQIAETTSGSQLTRLGLKRVGKLFKRPDRVEHPDAQNLFTFSSEEKWENFLEVTVPKLEKLGFRIEIDRSFPHLYAQVEDWYGETEEQGGWFTLELGVVIEGQKQSLLPILVSLIAERPELFTPQALAALNDDDIIEARLPDGRKIKLPAGRVRAILSVLVELHLRELPPGPLKLPLLDALRLAQLDEALKARWVGAERLLELGKRLREFGGVQDVRLPKGVNAELRPYQKQGLNWLQFLREYELGGILADDMGLGKTLQTLTHLQLEKEQGRADLPSLVIAPTSVIGNWRNEAARFTPSLKVLVLHGPERKAHFADIPKHDLVLTTYPLLPRDIEILRQHEFHLLILDEAQNIKNNRTAAAKAAGAIKARHRLALTGTPLENHLGELWSQFNFLAPGLLYDEKMFRELYRTPIEKHGDAARQRALAARVKPFILRREKRDVVKELPPKTEIPVRVTLQQGQRDLYETVRVTMLERVREELDAKGLARSSIAILDALLKLRQAVTDPRLVKLEAARKVKGSAKLTWLEQNLPQMTEEGRRILIFSQFATLLGYLEETLTELGIPYSKLTGQTKDRATPVQRFQSGETHVFLISLKAGGVGLNLTAADTVIHLDPWWNPAAENQATDRAYRIGQDKPVFVYKLIAAGSVEERILEMQERKAALAKGVLDGGLTSASQLTQGDLDVLFAPLDNDDAEG